MKALRSLHTDMNTRMCAHTHTAHTHAGRQAGRQTDRQTSRQMSFKFIGQEC
jgi:hypothetical protein